MSKILIDITDDTYTLLDEGDVIKSNRRAKLNFKSINATFDEPNKIVIPFIGDNRTNDSNRDWKYKLIEKLLKKFNIQFTQTVQAQKILSDINKQNEDWEQFSQKAKNIRNNKHTGDDFKNFVNFIHRKSKREFYPLQLLSAYHMAFSQNACNFSVPGAGKTSIVYGVYAYLNNLPKDNPKYVNRLLVVSPLAAFAPWENEYEEIFDNPPSSIRLNIPPNDRQNHFYSQQDTELTLISYQNVSSDVEDVISYLKRHNVMLVLDEAHHIKNVEGGKWAEAVLDIAKYAKSRIVLTGTPAPNGYQDLYNLFKFIWPYRDVINFPLHYLQNLISPKEITKLINNISPFFIRIKKSDLKLPEPITHNPICVEMSSKQKFIYDYIEKRYVNYFESNFETSTIVNKLKKAKLIRLRQCLTNPKLLQKPLDNYLDFSDHLGIDDRQMIKSIREYDTVPEKFIAVADLLENIIKNPGPDGKVIIWALFIGNIRDLSEYLKTRNIQCKQIYGETPNETNETPKDIQTREKIINQFHDDLCPYKVIIANPQAVGESISLHKACHNAIYLEKDFNAATYMQSKDRIHRYGLSNDDRIHYYHIISDNSIDITIYERVLEKEARMLEIIEKEEIPLLSMNMDTFGDDDDTENDIKAIIRDYHARKSTSTS